MRLNAVNGVTVLVFFSTRIWSYERFNRIKTAFFTGAHQNFQIEPFAFLLFSFLPRFLPLSSFSFVVYACFRLYSFRGINDRDVVGC